MERTNYGKRILSNARLGKRADKRGGGVTPFFNYLLTIPHNTSSGGLALDLSNNSMVLSKGYDVLFGPLNFLPYIAAGYKTLKISASSTNGGSIRLERSDLNPDTSAGMVTKYAGSIATLSVGTNNEVKENSLGISELTGSYFLQLSSSSSSTATFKFEMLK